VEIEIGVLRGQCLSRRIGERKQLVAQIAAWEKQRNKARAGVADGVVFAFYVVWTRPVGLAAQRRRTTARAAASVGAGRGSTRR
jgi:hypothetical protein